MKKLFIFLAVLVILPAMAFAQLSLGPAVFFKSPVLLGQDVDVEKDNVDQFSIGPDLRYRLGWFQVGALGLISIGEITSLDIFLDAGVALDISIFTLSFGAGPNFTVNFDGDSVAEAGLNANLGADVNLGNVAVGLSYIMSLNIDDGIDINTSSGLLGAHVLFLLGNNKTQS